MEPSICEIRLKESLGEDRQERFEGTMYIIQEVKVNGKEHE
jgi:hypothetical protein